MHTYIFIYIWYFHVVNNNGRKKYDRENGFWQKERQIIITRKLLLLWDNSNFSTQNLRMLCYTASYLLTCFFELCKNSLSTILDMLTPTRTEIQYIYYVYKYENITIMTSKRGVFCFCDWLTSRDKTWTHVFRRCDLIRFDLICWSLSLASFLSPPVWFTKHSV